MFHCRAGLLLLASLLLTTPAHADGVFMPQRAFPALPAIPSQSAIIVHRDGIQTLIVESGFQTDAPAVAWILPLPAPPTKLESVEPGIITSATSALRPDLVHDLPGLWNLACVFFLLALLPCLAQLLTRDPEARRRNTHSLILVGLVLICLSAILLPSLGKARGGPGDASVLSVTRLPGAEFSVLTAEDPAALNDWLIAHDMKPLSADATPIVADYIARKWCFVVGTLTRDGAGTQFPRPLAATFPTPTPVFPMKLTALANTTTHVELVVVSSTTAAAGGFHRLASDAFSPGTSYQGALRYQYGPAYLGHATGMVLGATDLGPYLWTGCAITKLAADLTPLQMRDDIALRSVPLRSTKSTFYSRRALGQITATVTFSLATVLLVYAAVLFRGRRRPPPMQRLIFTRVAGFSCLLLPAIWLLLPTTDVRLVPKRAFYDMTDVLHYDAERAAQDGALRLDMADDSLVSALRPYTDRRPNYFAGNRVRREHSPGNFDFRRIDDKLFFCTYDQNGVEKRTRLLPAQRSR